MQFCFSSYILAEQISGIDHESTTAVRETRLNVNSCSIKKQVSLIFPIRKREQGWGGVGKGEKGKK